VSSIGIEDGGWIRAENTDVESDHHSRVAKGCRSELHGRLICAFENGKKGYGTNTSKGSLNRPKCEIWLISVYQKKDGLPNMIKEIMK
jgi:hypothetical protein